MLLFSCVLWSSGKFSLTEMSLSHGVLGTEWSPTLFSELWLMCGPCGATQLSIDCPHPSGNLPWDSSCYSIWPHIFGPLCCSCHWIHGDTLCRVQGQLQSRCSHEYANECPQTGFCALVGRWLRWSSPGHRACRSPGPEPLTIDVGSILSASYVTTWEPWCEVLSLLFQQLNSWQI